MSTQHPCGLGPLADHVAGPLMPVDAARAATGHGEHYDDEYSTGDGVNVFRGLLVAIPLSGAMIAAAFIVAAALKAAP